MRREARRPFSSSPRSERWLCAQVARAEVARMLRAARREEAAARSGGGAPDDALMAYIRALERAQERVG